MQTMFEPTDTQSGSADAMPPSLEMIDRGIAAARSGNRLQARWQLESVAATRNVPPEVWLWLAWVAESPAKAQRYLNKLRKHSRLASVAKGGLSWLEALSGQTGSDFDPGMSGPDDDARASSADDPYEYRVTCPDCHTLLCVRPKAIGQSRHCPACDERILFSLESDGQVVAQRSPEPEPTVPETIIPPATSLGASTDRNTILVVDDSPTIRRVATMVLSQNGYRVLTAKSGEEGLSMVSQELPSLILLDINMPGIGGYEVCKRLRATRETSHIPVVMLSGKDGFYDQVKGYQAGSSKYLTKPCEAGALLTTVKKLLSRSQAAKS